MPIRTIKSIVPDSKAKINIPDPDPIEIPDIKPNQELMKMLFASLLKLVFMLLIALAIFLLFKYLFCKITKKKFSLFGKNELRKVNNTMKECVRKSL